MTRLAPLLRHPLFLGGLAIRLALIAGMAPAAVAAWYAPFLANSAATLSLDPWSAWLAGGGTEAAFPYGYAAWLVFLPGALLAKLAGFQVHTGYSVTLLCLDFGLLAALDRLVPGRRGLLLGVYWLSPVVILATYALGFNDVLPVLLLLLATWLAREARLRSAGVLLAASVSAKLSMVLAVPFFAIYLFNRRALRQRMWDFVLGFAACAFVLGLPFLLSPGAFQMLAGNPEVGKVYELAVHFGSRSSLYVVPLVYFLLLYFAWRIRRLNFEIFHSSMGVAFLSIVLMTPAAPGWFMWCMPFLVLYQAMSGGTTILVAAAFSAAYVFHTLLSVPLQATTQGTLDLANFLRSHGLPADRLASLVHTAMVAIGIVLAVRMWREAVGRNDYFRLSRKPFVLGIAGDSGAGKDTFADAVVGLFGQHSVVKLSGDDYHLWDRQKPMWQVMTHLNPMANDLEGFARDLLALVDGKPVMLKHYDHHTGKMTKPVRTRSNDFIIASGLHALYLPILRDRYDLKIYLDIDERLRRHFKMERDVKVRKHTPERVLSALERREPDSQRFIRPQLQHADLALSLQPIRPDLLEGGASNGTALRLKLVVRTRQGANERSLHRILVGVCGLHVDMVLDGDGRDVQMSIEGEATPADLRLAAGMLCPGMEEFLDIPARWQEGPLGVMQLVVLSHIQHALARRLIW